jgi:hypothetical protein
LLGCPEALLACPETLLAFAKPLLASPDPLLALPNPMLASPDPLLACAKLLLASPKLLLASPDPLLAFPKPLLASPDLLLNSPDLLLACAEAMLTQRERLLDTPRTSFPSRRKKRDGSVGLCLQRIEKLAGDLRGRGLVGDAVDLKLEVGRSEVGELGDPGASPVACTTPWIEGPVRKASGRRACAIHCIAMIAGPWTQCKLTFPCGWSGLLTGHREEG